MNPRLAWTLNFAISYGLASITHAEKVLACSFLRITQRKSRQIATAFTCLLTGAWRPSIAAKSSWPATAPDRLMKRSSMPRSDTLSHEKGAQSAPRFSRALQARPSGHSTDPPCPHPAHCPAARARTQPTPPPCCIRTSPAAAR